MGYTKFALNNLVTPGDVMPRCSGDRVFKIQLGPQRCITMKTTTEACMFVVVPHNYDNTIIPWDLSNVPMKRHSCNEVSVLLQPNTTWTVFFDVDTEYKQLHVYTYDCPAGYNRYYPSSNKVPNCSSVTSY